MPSLRARDKVNFDILRPKDETLDRPDLLPPPAKIAAEIVENPEAGLDCLGKAAQSLRVGNHRTPG